MRNKRKMLFLLVMVIFKQFVHAAPLQDTVSTAGVQFTPAPTTAPVKTYKVTQADSKHKINAEFA